MLLGCVFVVREVRTRGESGESKMNRVMYSWLFRKAGLRRVEGDG